MTQLSAAVNILIRLLEAIINKEHPSSLVWQIAAQIPSAMQGIREFLANSTEEQIDAAIAELDIRTGTDEGAFDLIKTLPADKEEELLDAVGEAVRIIIKNRLQSDGYYMQPNTGNTDNGSN